MAQVTLSSTEGIGINVFAADYSDEVRLHQMLYPSAPKYESVDARKIMKPSFAPV